MKSFTPLLILVGLITVISAALSRLGISKDIIGIILTSVTALYPKIESIWTERSKTNQEKITELVTGNIYIDPVRVVFYIICYMQFVERGVGGVFGLAISMALGVSGQGISLIQSVVLTISPLFAILFLLFAIVPIAKYATHRLKEKAVFWILVAVLIDQAITLAVAAAWGGISLNTEAVLSQLVVVLLLLPGILIGYWRAKKTQQAYRMNHLYKQLSDSDQKALMDLALTLPETSAKR